MNSAQCSRGGIAVGDLCHTKFVVSSITLHAARSSDPRSTTA